MAQTPDRGGDTPTSRKDGGNSRSGTGAGGSKIHSTSGDHHRQHERLDFHRQDFERRDRWGERLAHRTNQVRPSRAVARRASDNAAASPGAVQWPVFISAAAITNLAATNTQPASTPAPTGNANATLSDSTQSGSVLQVHAHQGPPEAGHSSQQSRAGQQTRSNRHCFTAAHGVYPQICARRGVGPDRHDWTLSFSSRWRQCSSGKSDYQISTSEKLNEPSQTIPDADQRTAPPAWQSLCLRSRDLK